MKKFVSAVVILVLLASCSKQDLAVPRQEDPAEVTIPSDVFYKDANVAIAGVNAISSGDNIQFVFTSLYEKNVSRVEVIGGPYENVLCFFYTQSLPANSVSAKSYSVTENGAASSVRYYFIKYTLRTGGTIITQPFRYEK